MQFDAVSGSRMRVDVTGACPEGEGALYTPCMADESAFPPRGAFDAAPQHPVPEPPQVAQPYEPMPPPRAGNYAPPQYAYAAPAGYAPYPYPPPSPQKKHSGWFWFAVIGGSLAVLLALVIAGFAYLAHTMSGDTNSDRLRWGWFHRGHRYLRRDSGRGQG